MRIAYFGMPLGALLLRRDGHELPYVALSRDEGPGVRRARRTLDALVRPDLGSPAAVARVARAAPDLLVSWFWTTRLPAAVLALAPAFGVHPSLLPRHRGPDPTFWTLDAGDEVTGVTAHRLDGSYDTGAILQKSSMPVDPAWNAWDLAKRLDRPSLALLRSVAAAYARGTPPPGIPQDERLATNAPVPTEDMLEIRWDQPAARIARRVRAAAPWPGAFTELGGEVVVLTRVRPTDDFPRALAPGEGTVRTAREGASDGTNVAVVRAGDVALELLAGRRETDDTELDAEALAAQLGALRQNP